MNDDIKKAGGGVIVGIVLVLGGALVLWLFSPIVAAAALVLGLALVLSRALQGRRPPRPDA